MDEGFTQKLTFLLFFGNMFHDVMSVGNNTIDMPPVVTVFEGEDVELECKARYANGTLISACDERHGLTLKWTIGRTSEIMAFEEIARCGRVVAFKNKTVEFNKDNGNITLLNVDLSDEAEVHCAVIGLDDRLSSKTKVRVKKTTFGVQTEIDLSPGEGETVTLVCSVLDSGTTTHRNFTYRWSFNNTLLQSCITTGEVDQTGKYVLHHGKTSCNLTIRNVNLNDEGTYQCDVHDSFYNQSSNSFTGFALASKPVSTTSTNYMTDVGSTEMQTVTLTTAQGLGATVSFTSAWNGLVLVTFVSSSGLLVAFSLIVFALRLHKKRYSATPKSQTNATSTATVTFRRGPSQGNAHMIALNQSSGGENQDAGTSNAGNRARVNGNPSLSSPLSLIDNQNVKQHYDCGNGVMYTLVNRQKSHKASAVYTGVAGAAAIDYLPKKVARQGELVYADLQHTRRHPPNAPPIRTESPTQYAEVHHNMTEANRSGASKHSCHIFDNNDEMDLWMVESEDEAPLPPPRGIFNSPLYY